MARLDGKSGHNSCHLSMPWLLSMDKGASGSFAKAMRKYRDAHPRSSTERMRRRVEYKGERPDFIHGLLQKSEQF